MISVIIPAYNASRTIKKCVDSVLKQDYRDIEVIVVDDGSTDDTGVILSKLKSFDSRVITITQSNGGVSKSRNAGIKMAKGDFIFFLDADDYLCTDSLSLLVEAYNNNKAELIACEIVDQNNSAQVKNVYRTIPNFFANDKISIGKNLMYIRTSSAVGKLYKTSIIKENNLLFIESLNLAEDLIFVHQYCLLINSIEKEGKSKYIVQNVNENSLSKNFVNNIETTICKQNEILESTYIVYPEYKKVWYQYNMDIYAKGCTFFIKNLFLKGCPYTFKQKFKKLYKYLITDKQIVAFSSMTAETCPKNYSEKIQSIICKTRSILLIIICFYLIERVKQKRISR